YHRNLPPYPTRRSSDLYSRNIRSGITAPTNRPPRAPRGNVWGELKAKPSIASPRHSAIRFIQGVDCFASIFLPHLASAGVQQVRSEEHTSELQSRENLV